MTPCPESPDGDHDWRTAGHESSAGSTLLTCKHGCGEVAYLLREVA